MRSWRRSCSFPASCSAATPGRRCSSICPSGSTRGRSTTASTTSSGRLDEIAAAGEGAVLCGYSLGGRLALRAALREPEPLPRRDHDRGVGRASRSRWRAARARGGRAPGRVDGDDADRGDRDASGSASRCSPTSPTRWWTRSAPGRLSHDPRVAGSAAAHGRPGRARARCGTSCERLEPAAAGGGGRARRALRARRRADGRRWLPRAARPWWRTPATRRTCSSRRRWRR